MVVRVIFHIDELSKWSLLLRNAHNLTKAVDLKSSRIEVLANSEAVKFYADSASDSNKDLMQELAHVGIRFMACNNALNEIGISRDQLPQFVGVVPVGVLELIGRQSLGYAYIKP